MIYSRSKFVNKSTFLMIFLFFLTPLSALDKIFLNDGTILTGHIVSQTADVLKFESNFNTLSIKKYNIEKMIFVPDKKVSLILKDHSVLTGIFISENFKKIKILDSNAEEKIIFKTNLMSIVFTTNIPEQKKETNLSFQQKHSRVSALWRSAVIPSWGQFYSKTFTKGYIIASSEFLSLSLALSSYAYFYSLYPDFVNEPTYDKANVLKLWNNINHLSLVAAGAIYLYNIIDAYFFSTPKSLFISAAQSELFLLKQISF